MSKERWSSRTHESVGRITCNAEGRRAGKYMRDKCAMLGCIPGTWIADSGLQDRIGLLFWHLCWMLQSLVRDREVTGDQCREYVMANTSMFSECVKYERYGENERGSIVKISCIQLTNELVFVLVANQTCFSVLLNSRTMLFFTQIPYRSNKNAHESLDEVAKQSEIRVACIHSPATA